MITSSKNTQLTIEETELNTCTKSHKEKLEIVFERFSKFFIYFSFIPGNLLCLFIIQIHELANENKTEKYLNIILGIRTKSSSIK